MASLQVARAGARDRQATTEEQTTDDGRERKQEEANGVVFRLRLFVVSRLLLSVPSAVRRLSSVVRSHLRLPLTRWQPPRAEPGAQAGTAGGSSIVKVVPPRGHCGPGSRPPWAAASCCETARPRPVTHYFVVTKSVKSFSCTSGGMGGPVLWTAMDTADSVQSVATWMVPCWRTAWKALRRMLKTTWPRRLAVARDRRQAGQRSAPRPRCPGWPRSYRQASTRAATHWLTSTGCDRSAAAGGRWS